MKFNFKAKFLLLITMIIVLFALASILTNYTEINSIVKQNIDSAANISLRYIGEKYKGDWKIKEDKLLKGNQVMDNNFYIVDRIKKDLNLEVSIFRGDERVATTIARNGKKIVGTKANKEAIQKTLKDGKVYNGQTKILDKTYYVKYVPIKDANGKIIGMFFLGIQTKNLNSFLINTIIVTIIIILISVFLEILFSRNFIKPLSQMTKQLGIISKGEFACVIPENYKGRSDEIGDISRSIDFMQRELRETIKGLKEKFNHINLNSQNLDGVSSQMKEAAENVSYTMQDVAKGTSSQAEDLVEITNIFEEFSKQVIKISKEVNSVTESAKGINTLANDSGESMIDLEKSINTIDNAFKEFIHKIDNLNEEMKKINNMTDIINSIADQTNLLALNAAIEAARAGEQGKGFGVVSEEIRKLAEQVKLSSMDINKVLAEITEYTGRIVKDSEEIENEMISQTEVVNIAMQSFQNIVLAVGDIIPKIENVNSSTAIIDGDKNEILGKVEMASSVAEQISASAQEVSAASQEMSASAENVTESSKVLKNLSEDMFERVKIFKV